MHLLDRVRASTDGRRTGVVHAERGAQLLQRLDQRVPHRRGRRDPITQLAFTLANGFTIVEAYLARGMAIDEFAPNLSFFFSNGMDPSTASSGAWRGGSGRGRCATAWREPRSEMPKYHIQTSGRSLHAQESTSTTSALRCRRSTRSSTTATACTRTPTTRRSRPRPRSPCGAVAIQLIINGTGLKLPRTRWRVVRHRGASPTSSRRPCTRSSSGSLSAAACSARSETMYQRSKNQDDSLTYEQRKHDGSLPIGVSTPSSPTARRPRRPRGSPSCADRGREADADPRRPAFSAADASERGAALGAAAAGSPERRHVFGELMETVKVATLGEIWRRWYNAVGGEYRRSM